MKWRSQNCERGTTLPEVMVAAAILGILIMALTSALSAIYRQTARSQNDVMRDKYIARLVGDIQANPQAFAPNFADNSIGGVTNDQLLAVNTLPIWFGPNYYGDATGCPTCDGRMGFVIRPYYGYSGLYVVTIRIVTSIKIGTYQDIQELIAER